MDSDWWKVLQEERGADAGRLRALRIQGPSVADQSDRLGTTHFYSQHCRHRGRQSFKFKTSLAYKIKFQASQDYKLRLQYKGLYEVYWSISSSPSWMVKRLCFPSLAGRFVSGDVKWGKASNILEDQTLQWGRWGSLGEITGMKGCIKRSNRKKMWVIAILILFIGLDPSTYQQASMPQQDVRGLLRLEKSITKAYVCWYGRMLTAEHYAPGLQRSASKTSQEVSRWVLVPHSRGSEKQICSVQTKRKIQRKKNDLRSSQRREETLRKSLEKCREICIQYIRIRRYFSSKRTKKKQEKPFRS